MSALNHDQQIRKFVDRHNEYRARHHAPPLVWDTKLAKYASDWAERGVFQHSNGPYGENIAFGSSKALELVTAVDMWFGEMKKYDFNHPGFSHNTGHATQVVWKASQKIGVGWKDLPNGSRLIVAEYWPPGNVMNQFPANVLREHA